jgi:hypothetical protein
MTRREKAERVFRQLNVENRGLLLKYLEAALEAEKPAKKPPALTAAGRTAANLRECRRRRP